MPASAAASFLLYAWAYSSRKALISLRAVRTGTLGFSIPWPVATPGRRNARGHHEGQPSANATGECHTSLKCLGMEPKAYGEGTARSAAAIDQPPAGPSWSGGIELRSERGG